MQIAFDVATFDNFLSTGVVKRDLGEQASDIQTELFALAELRVEENIAEFADGTCCQLRIALVDIGQVAEGACDLH